MLLFIQLVVYDLLSFPFFLNFGDFPFGKSFLHAWFRFSCVFMSAIESTSRRKELSFLRCAGVVLRSFPLFSVSKLIRSSRRWFQTKRQQPKVFQMSTFCSMVGLILNSMHLETMTVSALPSIIPLFLCAEIFVKDLHRCPLCRDEAVAVRPEVTIGQPAAHFRKVLLHEPRG